MTTKVIPKTNADEFCRQIIPSEKPLYIRDSQVKGLVLRVMPTGSKSWIIRYSVRDGEKWRERKTGLGSFRLARNDVTGLTVNSAREEAERIKRDVKYNGADPVADKRKEASKRALEAASLITVEELFERWAKTDLIRRSDKGQEAQRMMRKDVLPYIGLINIREIRRSHISEIADHLLQRGVNRMAKIVFSLVRQMFRFAVSRDLLEIDPTALISKKQIGGSNLERDRVLSEDEIKELSLKLAESKIPEASSIAIWISLSTCCRIGEVLKARWNHIDFDKSLWFIPGTNSKNRREHTVYLSSFALHQFLKLHQITGKSEWCYPSKNAHSHICPKTVTKQVTDRQRIEGAYSKRTSSTKALILSRGTWKPHDLRRTGATLMNALGVIPEVAERCLNHAEENKMKRIYQRYGYEREMREAWNKLGDHLELITQIEIGNIISLKEVVA